MTATRVFDMERSNLPLLNSLEELARPGVSMGVCLSAAMMWIRETMVRGDMHSDEVICSNRQIITMRQASYQFESRINHCDYLDLNRTAIDRLVEQFHLMTRFEGEGDLLDFAEIAEVLQCLAGYYLLYFKNPQGDRGHAVAFKFTTSGAGFLFDPAEGLFRFRDTPSMSLYLRSMNGIGYEAYMGGQFWFRQLALA
ncbi:MAG: hypothetical protein OEZ39_01905 [Gammaproteobacteria bacterium]|nr:hypothetical protein [Gammaproteobacteria bacterium]MDH5650608.1 hypothetical protein [Gammaproteobacteria bacterium]